MIKDIVLSDAEAIISPNLHDGTVDGILLLPNNTVFILVKNLDHQVYCLSLSGVDLLKMDDFRQGNIILDITISVGENICKWDFIDLCGYKEDDHVGLSLRAAKATQNQTLSVRITPSYGGSLVCLCQSIEIEKDWVVKMANAFGAVSK